MAIKYYEIFFNSLKMVTKVSNKMVLQQSEPDKVIIAQQSEGKEINIFIEAPKEVFDYDKDVAFGDFANFYSVFGATGDKPEISILEANNEANIVHVDGEYASVDYGLSIHSLMNPGKTMLPPVKDDGIVTVNITEADLKNIKQLTSSLIVSGSSSGTKLNILKEKGSDELKLTFKAHESVGHQFSKEFKTSINKDVEVKLVFDPLFFTWLPVNDYTFTVATGDGIINHIKALGIIKDGEGNEVCKQYFVAGPLKVTYVA